MAIVIATLVVTFSLAAPASAVDFTLDFEGVPQTHWHNVGDTNLGDYYASQGVHFGPDVTVLEDQVHGYDTQYYPPHSGHAVIFSDALDYFDVTFDMPVTSVHAWYQCDSTFFEMQAFDSSDNEIASDSGGSTWDATVREYWWADLGVSNGAARIARVRFHDTGGVFTVDDLHIAGPDGPPSDDSPEPGTWVLLACTGVVGALVRRRRTT